MFHQGNVHGKSSVSSTIFTPNFLGGGSSALHGNYIPISFVFMLLHFIPFQFQASRVVSYHRALMVQLAFPEKLERENMNVNVYQVNLNNG